LFTPIATDPLNRQNQPAEGRLQSKDMVEPPGNRYNDSMSAADNNAFDRGIDPILQIILSSDKARTVVEYRADQPLQERIEQLATRCTEGELSEAERTEYEGYVRANNFVAILQAKARKLLANANG